MERKMIVGHCHINGYEAFDLEIVIRHKVVNFLKKEYQHLAAFPGDLPDEYMDKMTILDELVVTFEARSEMDIKGDINIVHNNGVVTISYVDMKRDIVEEGFNSISGAYFIKTIRLRNCIFVVRLKDVLEEAKKPDKWVLLNGDGEMLMTSDDRDEIVGFRNNMLTSKHFLKGKVRATVIAENKIR